MDRKTKKREPGVQKIVKDIINKIRSGGDSAISDLILKLDKARIPPEDFLVTPEDLEKAHKKADASFLDLVRKTASNIREYQEHILIRPPSPLIRGKRKLSVRYTPVDKAAVYVPGGKAVYPSTVLMTVIPAQVAGVKEIVMASPPSEEGEINPMVLALACEFGIKKVYKMGGAVAIAALAMGTKTVNPVNKIVGPGNAFVAEAKKQLFGHVGIDSIAGPSEVLIIADGGANPAYIASDMLAQTEHNPGSAILITDSLNLAKNTASEIEIKLGRLERAEAIDRGINSYSACIVVDNLNTACKLADEFAAEHLQIITKDNEMYLNKINNFGAVFLGKWTPVATGDYLAGPSHVLPTGGTSKFFGALSCNDFRKSQSIIEYDRASLAEDANSIVDFALREGLTAHAMSVKDRNK